MNHNECASLARNAHNFQDFPVSEGKAFIGHENFERGVAIRYETRQFLSKHLLSRIRNNEMEGSVSEEGEENCQGNKEVSKEEIKSEEVTGAHRSGECLGALCLSQRGQAKIQRQNIYRSQAGPLGRFLLH